MRSNLGVSRYLLIKRLSKVAHILSVNRAFIVQITRIADCDYQNMGNLCLRL